MGPIFVNKIPKKEGSILRKLRKIENISRFWGGETPKFRKSRQISRFLFCLFFWGSKIFR